MELLLVTCAPGELIIQVVFWPAIPVKQAHDAKQRSLFYSSKELARDSSEDAGHSSWYSWLVTAVTSIRFR